jgi:DNA-binding winged helix-turn-helix (wHTH) protein
MKLRFGDCVFDADARQLLRAERSVAVSPKAFELLGLLIAARPAAVSKTEIHARLWPDVHVSDANLPNLVGKLRAALGEKARRPRIIRTVPRFGYAFCSPARIERPKNEVAPGGSGPVYHLVWGTREIALQPGENLIGRGAEAAIWIDDESVSRRHARISIGPSGATIEDLGSKNGTYIGGRKLHRASPLSNRDTVRIGPATLTLRVLRRSGSTRSAMGKARR